jgi:general secretion pathway protein J
MRMVASTRAQGFTLLEVLMAVMLLAVLIGGAYGGLRASANAMRAGEAAIDRTDRLRTAQEFLRRQFSQIVPLAFAHDDKEGLNVVFEGDGRFMRFVAPMPGYLSRGGPYVQTLELVRGKDGLQLQFTDTMLNGYDTDTPAKDDVAPVVLLDHIAAGRFFYRGLDEQGLLADWSSDWASTEVTPLMLRVELSMQPGVQIPWPTLDAPLMLNGGAMRQSLRVTGPGILHVGRRRQ